MLQQVEPVLGVKNVDASVEFYVSRLGFTLAFKTEDHPQYAVVWRDNVVLHLQWHDPAEWTGHDRPMLRFVVSDIESLFGEFEAKGHFSGGTTLRSTPWGTREFAFYDPDMYGLTFYVDL